jgi:hypothetical protein
MAKNAGVRGRPIAPWVLFPDFVNFLCAKKLSRRHYLDRETPPIEIAMSFFLRSAYPSTLGPTAFQGNDCSAWRFGLRRRVR